jgi:molecular chaperone Hsp33
MHDRDSLHRFVFEHYPIRGHLVHLDAAWLALIEHRAYPDAIRGLLGEAVAASLLLAATIKFDGVLSLQLQGDGPVHLLLAQCTSGLGVRGLARYRSLEGEPAAHGIGALIGTGNLTVTLETDDGAQRYQGIVPIEGARLAESLQLYFQNSEQLPMMPGSRACCCSVCRPVRARERAPPPRRSRTHGGACNSSAIR